MQRYDDQKLENLQTAVLKLESGKRFDPTDTNRTEKRGDDRDKASSFFKIRRKSREKRVAAADLAADAAQ